MNRVYRKAGWTSAKRKARLEKAARLIVRECFPLHDENKHWPKFVVLAKKVMAVRVK